MQYFGNFLGITRHRQKNYRQSLSFDLVSHFSLAAFFCLFGYLSAAFGESETLMARSVERLVSLKTIECNLRMNVWVDEIKFSSRGRYEEQAGKRSSPHDFLRSMYRLDLNFLSDVPLAPGSDPNRMTIVCHISEDRAKSQIWQYKSIEGRKDLRIIRLQELENAVQQSTKDYRLATIGEMRYLGGICAMMRQIVQFYEFEGKPQNTVLDAEDGIDVWKLTGRLRQEYYEELLERFGGLGKRKKMPNGFPCEIELWIGRNDFFPYKITYFGRPTEGSKKRFPIVQTSYFDVVLNGEEIDLGNFALFNENGEYPEGVFNFKDDTEEFIHSLGL